MAGHEVEVEVEVDGTALEVEDRSASGAASGLPLVLAGSGTTSRARRMTDRLRADPSLTHPRFELPDWLHQLYEKQESPERILALLYERVHAGGVDLHVAYRVVNDIGRLPDGGELLERAGTMAALAALPGRTPSEKDG